MTPSLEGWPTKAKEAPSLPCGKTHCLVHCLKNLGYFYQLTASYLRGLHTCLQNDGNAERNGKRIQSPNYMSPKGVNNLGNYA